MTVLAAAEKLGIDMGITLYRFGGNLSLFERFIRKFAQDTTFTLLREAAKVHDLETLERSAHTLKGTAANLGLDQLSRFCGLIVTALREGRQGPQELAPLVADAQMEYNRVIETIAQLS